MKRLLKPYVAAMLLVASGNNGPVAQPKMLPTPTEAVELRYSCDDDGICAMPVADLLQIVRLARRGASCP